MNHFTIASWRQQVSRHFTVLDSRPANDYLVLVTAEKPSGEIEVGRTDPLVSICITTYNRASFVRQCVESVLKQTFGRTEVIVVDDGSTDQTRQVLESFGSAIRVFYNEGNQGIGFSKNRALMMSSPSARYVGILDSDDYFHPSFVERCVGSSKTILTLASSTRTTFSLTQMAAS